MLYSTWPNRSNGANQPSCRSDETGTYETGKTHEGALTDPTALSALSATLLTASASTYPVYGRLAFVELLRALRGDGRDLTGSMATCRDTQPADGIAVVVVMFKPAIVTKISGRFADCMKQ